MATESPLRMTSHKEAATFAPSTPSMAVEDLVLLRKGQMLRGSGRDAPHRSGSAPPSMEGSCLAINNLMSQQSSNIINIGSYSKVNPNLRLPTPPVPWESRHTGHHTGRVGSNRDRSSSCLHLSQVTLSTHMEESAEGHSLEKPYDDLVEGTNRFWSADADSFVAQSKSLVALIQEDFPRTPSPVYNQSQSLSSGATDDVADHDASIAASSPDRNITVMSSIADPSTPSSPSVNCTGTAQVTPHLKGNLNSESVIESQMKELNILSHPNSKEPQNQEQWKNIPQSNMAQHQLHQHQNNAFHIQAAKSSMGLQRVNSTYIGIDQFVQAPSKLAAEGQQVLQSSGFTPPLYANATGYMPSQNTHYPSLQALGLYSPQYGVGAYALNSTAVPPFVSVYPSHGTVPMFFDGSISPSFNGRMSGDSSCGTMTQGVDMQHFNRSYGHLGYVQQSFTDPMYVQYHQQLYGPAYGISGQFNPMSGNALIGNQNNAPDLKRGSEVPSVLEDQKMLHQRSGMSNLNQCRGGVMNHHYYGGQQNMGILMQYPSSPLSSPVFPESPLARTGITGGRNEIRYPVGTNRYAAVYSGWQGQRGLETSNNPAIYNFLEELKSGKGRKFELSDITGHIVEFSADQHGSRFIQQKLENCNAEDKASVFKEVLPYASKLITDVFGNYVIQKFFEYGSHEQRKELACQLTGQILPLSLQMYGCRVIQKALDAIELDQKAQLVRELDGHVMRCVRDQNGNHVIQKCIESLPTEKIGFIISSFRGEVATLSMHPYGCRVVQRILEHCTDDIQCQFIVDEILESVHVLAQDQYGNYVTQHVLQRRRSLERCQIISKLSGHIVQLSQHKFASNVIEKCLEYGGTAERELIIEEILGQNEGNDNLLVMMKDQFANYVVQKILDMCTESQRAMLLTRIRANAHALKKYTYGKHIVSRFEQQFGEDDQT